MDKLKPNDILRSPSADLPEKDAVQKKISTGSIRSQKNLSVGSGQLGSREDPSSAAKSKVKKDSPPEEQNPDNLFSGDLHDSASIASEKGIQKSEAH